MANRQKSDDPWGTISEAKERLVSVKQSREVTTWMRNEPTESTRGSKVSGHG